MPLCSVIKIVVNILIDKKLSMSTTNYVILLPNVRSRFLFMLVALTFILQVSSQNSLSANNHDFKVRGFHIDLRTQVMTLPALKAFAKELSDFGINTIVMEWEAAFPYKNNATIANKFSYSRHELKEFIDYCGTLGIDVIPLQQCFGHVDYILQHDRYSHLREDSKDPSQVCPLKTDDNITLFTDLITDISSMHKSKYIHLGGDETRLLGHCNNCKSKVLELGKSKLFVDYLKEMCKIVISLGKIPIIWADIILKYPEAASELPKNVVFVDWNYGWSVDLFGEKENIRNANIVFWGAPSIRSCPDNIYLTQWKKHFSNINEFIPYARKSKYEGVIMTSWSTSGIYSYIFDESWEIQKTYPIRNVYPLSGFRILVAAYAESLKHPEPQNTDSFILNYGMSRFGLNVYESNLLLELLKTPQELIKNGKEESTDKALFAGHEKATIRLLEKERDVYEVKNAFVNLQGKMNSIQPKLNKKEFEHLRLMLDLRVYYLEKKCLEAEFQSESFDGGNTIELLKNTNDLIAKSKIINKRFEKLNNGYLQDAEMKEITKLMDEKLMVIKAVIKQKVETAD